MNRLIQMLKQEIEKEINYFPEADGYDFNISSDMPFNLKPTDGGRFVNIIYDFELKKIYIYNKFFYLYIRSTKEERMKFINHIEKKFHVVIEEVNIV